MRYSSSMRLLLAFTAFIYLSNAQALGSCRDAFAASTNRPIVWNHTKLKIMETLQSPFVLSAFNSVIELATSRAEAETITPDTFLDSQLSDRLKTKDLADHWAQEIFELGSIHYRIDGRPYPALLKRRDDLFRDLDPHAPSGHTLDGVTWTLDRIQNGQLELSYVLKAILDQRLYEQMRSVDLRYLSPRVLRHEGPITLGLAATAQLATTMGSDNILMGVVAGLSTIGLRELRSMHIKSKIRQTQSDLSPLAPELIRLFESVE